MQDKQSLIGDNGIVEKADTFGIIMIIISLVLILLLIIFGTMAIVYS